jgi:hypothetical protein
MLVLSRKKNESIVINDDITIVVVEIRGDKVRLGVEAPKEVRSVGPFADFLSFSTPFSPVAHLRTPSQGETARRVTSHCTPP